MRQVSVKRAAQNREYTRLRRQFLEANPTCQCCLVTRATEVHHKAGRRGARLLDTEYWAALCHICHENITFLNRQTAYATGWLVHEWDYQGGPE